MKRWLALPTVLLPIAGVDGALAEARVVRVTIDRREGVLAGKAFGLAGPYETLVGTVEFALDPALRQNAPIVDLALPPRGGRECGDGWLMEQGFALAWMGWQWDVPDTPGLLRLRAPIATDAGRPITGLVRSVVVLDERIDRAPLSARGPATYPAIDPNGPDSRLYVRDRRLEPPRLVPRQSWRFVDPATVALDGGFEPGRLYQGGY